MKKLPILLFIAVAVFLGVSCGMDDENYWEQYADWRNANNAWLEQKKTETDATGEAYYTKVVPTWDTQAYVLMRFFNDTELTKNNLSPHSTSTVDVKYVGRMYNKVAFDSSFLRTAPADSVYRAYLPDMIKGWKIALQNMHIGDTCEVVIPYDYGYGSAGSGSILPYSHLVFGIKLVGIPGYEIKK